MMTARHATGMAAMTRMDNTVRKPWHGPELRRISVRSTAQGGGIEADFVIGGPPYSPPGGGIDGGDEN